jgi:hypothetical protein
MKVDMFKHLLAIRNVYVPGPYVLPIGMPQQPKTMYN